MHSILVKYAFCNNSDLFRSLGLRKRAKYWAFRLISVLYFPVGNMFCSNKITLAFRWRPCVNSRDTTGLSVAVVGYRAEQVFLQTHLISSTVCVGRPGSDQSSVYVKLRTRPFLATFSFHHRINDVLDVNDYSYTEDLACHRQDSLF